MNKVQAKSPLVINITNKVTILDIANILTTIGASPIMTNDKREVKELLTIAKAVGGALVINIGTLDEKQIELMKEAVKVANELEVKVILDPVGAGASKLRTNTALDLLTNYKIDIIRGNFSEINSLIGNEGQTKGVDSITGTNSEIAKICANKYQVTVLISGKVDFFSNGKIVEEISGGSAYLPKISGTGCMLSSIIGAYAAVMDNDEACKQGLKHVLQASEKAQKDVSNIIDFKIAWFREMENLANGK
ncbi:MAG: hydroxyethylthiazole kinase [Mycoplasmatales bacterium]